LVVLKALVTICGCTYNHARFIEENIKSVMNQIMKNFIYFIVDGRSTVDEVNLRCIGCGLCEVVCPLHAVRVVEKGCTGLKPIVNTNVCTGCGLCLELCPIPEIAEPDDLSKVRAVFQGYSRVPELYLHGASGGIVSSILYHLFDKKMIDAALVAFYDDKLNIYGDFITSKEEVVKHSGSYYQTSKQMLNIRKIHKYRSVVIVGLPCHIESLKKYAERFNLKNITLTISLFCTIGRMRAGFKDFLKETFNINLDAIKASKYLSRYGKERLGKVIIETQKRQVKYTFLSYLNYVDYFYTPLGCFNCRKMFGLNADISVGDDWGIKASRKIALIVANTERGESLLNEIKILKLRKIHQDVALFHLLRSQPIGTAIKIRRPMETKMILTLVKNVGLTLKRLHLPSKIPSLIRGLAISYIRHRASKQTKS